MMKNKSWIGLVIIFTTVAIPLLSWVVQKPLVLRFADRIATLTSLGQISSLVGMSLFALVLIVGARLKFLEDYFSGLNRMYIDHHRLGGYALIFLLMHPLLLAAKYIYTSSYSAAQFLLPTSTDLAKSFGIYGLLLMMLLLVITFYANWRYDLWKLSHKFLVVAFAFGLYHLIYIPSDTSVNMFLRYYLITFSVLALAAIFWRVVLLNVAIKKYQYQLSGIKNLPANTFELTLKPLGQQMFFSPGQFAFLGFNQNGFSRETHPFSIVSHPSDANLIFAAKVLGDYTGRLNLLKPGAKVQVEGPFGRFAPGLKFYNKQIWIAGGIGITPFISMAQGLAKNQKVDLYYSTKTQSESIYMEALQLVSQKNPNFRVFSHASDSHGRLTAEEISKNSEEIKKAEIFLCGPPAMMKSLRRQFVNLKINNGKIHSEEFSL